MAITKDKKKEILDKLQKVTDSNSVVFVNFHGLPATEINSLRNTLSNSGISYYVAKKTLIKKAFEDSKVEGDLPDLSGELAVAYSDDLTAPAREVFEFQKKFADNISILGGVFENKFLDKVHMEEIAQIPGMQTLRGMFVNVINSPIQGFVMTLKAYADKKA